MIAPHRFAVLAFTIGLIFLPAGANAEAALGTELLSAAPLIATTHPAKVRKPQTVAFNWLANGSTSASKARSKAAQKRNRVITGQGSWICSPAGFGQRSRCYAG
jgi:hypothetical protein